MQDISSVDNGAGASSGSESTPSSSGPTTALSALNSAASSAAAAEQSPASGTAGNGSGHGTPSSATAPTQQQPAPVNADPQSARGAIPYDRHEQALKNARDKATAEVMQRFAWANNLDPKAVQRAIGLVQRLDGDARSFHKQLAEELEAQNEDDPQPDYQTPDGKKVYSAEAMGKAMKALENRLRREIMGTVQPLLSEREKAEEAKKTEAAQTEQRQNIAGALAHARTLPLFTKENEPAISKEMEALPKATVDRIGVISAMYLAYANFVAKNQHRLTTEAQGQVHEDLRRKAAAASGQVTPGGNQPNVAPKTPTNRSELAKHMEQLAAE